MEPIEQNRTPAEEAAAVIQDTNHILVATQTAYAAIQAVLTLARDEARRIHDERIPGQIDRLRQICTEVTTRLAIAPVTVVHDPQLLEDEMGAGCLGVYNPDTHTILVGIRTSGHGISVVTTLRMLSYHILHQMNLPATEVAAVRMSLVPYFNVWPMKRGRTDIFGKELLSASN